VKTRGMTRREFLHAVGGGIVVLVSVDPASLLAQERRRSYPEDLNAYLRIDADGRVSIFSGKIEMGQGVMTSQAQMAAEELGVPLESIVMVLGDTDRCPWDMGTFGSLTTRMFGPALRAAAAEARAVLVRLASEKLGVQRDRLVVENGIVRVAADPSRKVSFGELAKGKQISRLVGEKAVVRAAKDFAVMGQSPKRLDARDKVTGRAKYAGDIRIPGMVYARILRPPALGATLKSVDASRARRLPGVTVVDEKDLVAVLHADPEAAEDALQAITARWDLAEARVDQEGIFDDLVSKAPAPEVKLTKGDPVAARKRATRVFESTYRSGYRAHAPIEPHAALARMKDGRMTVWASTQTPFPARDAVAEALGLSSKDVRVVTPYVGGGFGGKSSGRQIVEAARLAKITGEPVQVAWTRAEEFFLDTFDPATIVKIVSAVGDDGRIALWDYGVYCAGVRGTDLFYDIPNATIRSHGPPRGSGRTTGHPFAVGAWRAPGANTNVFAGESQIDVMAAAAKVDPLEFRLRNTADPRMRRVLQTAADAYGWSPAAGPTRRGRGIACGIDAGTYVALIADVEVDPKTGDAHVKRVVAAQDMGIVVNPEGARMQMEGCITMGLGYVFTEELRFEGGDILDRNFDTYTLPKFSWLPRIETILVKNDDLPPQGGGEPTIVPMGAVVANAIFDATGARLYRLPMTPSRILEAIARR
jgi:nicotinate dehydrogenase subunit B